MNHSNNINEVALAVSKLKNRDEIIAFFKDMFTESEIEVIGLRWEIAKKLDTAVPYTEIEKLTGASSATIAKVSEFLKYGFNGYRMALDKIQRKKPLKRNK